MPSNAPVRRTASIAPSGSEPYVAPVFAFAVRNAKRRSASRNGSGRNRTESAMLKTAVLAPTPSAIVSVAIAA